MASIIQQGLSFAASRVSSTLTYTRDTAVSATSYVAAAGLLALQGAYATTYSGLCSVGSATVAGVVTIARPIASYLLTERVDTFVRKKIEAIHLPGAQAAAFIKAQIRASHKLNPIEKQVALKVTAPLVSGLRWTRDIGLFKELALYATRALADYTGALKESDVTEAGEIYVTIMRAYETAIETGEEPFVLESLEKTLNSTRSSYEEVLARALGYESVASLEKQAFKSVEKQAGRFVINPSERGRIIRALCSFFESICAMIVGRFARRILKKKIKKLGKLTVKLHPLIDKALKKVTSKESRHDIKILTGAQAKIFALHALKSLMAQRENIFNAERHNATTFNAQARASLSSVAKSLAAAFIPSGETLRREVALLAEDRAQEFDFESAVEQLHSKISPWLTPQRRRAAAR